MQEKLSAAMLGLNIRPGWFVTVVVVATLAILTAVFWRQVSLGVGMLTAERRPALLKDADWDRPGTARRFMARFHPGATEGGLLQWLRDNQFVISDRGRASRIVQSLPCSEYIAVSWTVSRGKTIDTAEAQVSEARCRK